MSNTHRFVDFVTVLDVDARLDPYTELSFIELSMSKQVSKKDILDVDFEFKKGYGYAGIERRTCDFGSFQLNGEDSPVIQKDLLEEVEKVTGLKDIGAIIKRRDLHYRVRGVFNDVECLDGVEYFIVRQVSRGNHARMVKEQFGVPVLDPIEKTKSLILNKGVLKNDQLQLLSKMRSNQVSLDVLLDGTVELKDQKGFYELSSLLADNWNKDVATLSSLYSYQDFTNFNGRVYHLQKMDGDVVL